MKLNEKQKQNMRNLHFSMMSFSSNDNYARFLVDGEIVKFVNPYTTLSNIEFSIEGDSVRKIWYSQLANTALITEPELALGHAGLFMKDGSSYSIRDLGKDKFWQIVKDRSFRVDTQTQIDFVVDRKSSLLQLKPSLCYYVNLLKYISECIEKDEMSKLKEVLKRGVVYDLYEV